MSIIVFAVWYLEHLSPLNQPQLLGYLHYIHRVRALYLVLDLSFSQPIVGIYPPAAMHLSQGGVQ